MPWADLTDVRSYYELLGEGESVLLIPGLGATCRSWDSIAPDLAVHFSLILPDNRDVGNSIGKRKPRALSEIDEPDYRITAPTLVLAGEYDALVPNCYSKRMADEIPGAEFRILAGCGHNPVTERPEEALPLLVEFLKRKTEQKAGLIAP